MVCLSFICASCKSATDAAINWHEKVAAKPHPCDMACTEPPPAGVTGGLARCSSHALQWVALLVTFVNNKACPCVTFVKGEPRARIAVDNGGTGLHITFIRGEAGAHVTLD